MKNKNRKLIRDIKKDLDLYILLVPAFLIAFVLMYYVPMYGVVIAFKDYNLLKGILHSDWVGFAHFARLFRSPDFLLIIRNTLLLNLYNLIFGFPIPIILALFINEAGNVLFKRSVQSFLYIPHFISWVVLGGIVVSLLSPSTGVINGIIKMFGGEPIYFMADSFWWPVWYTISGIWKEAGWGTIIYMAAISGVDPSLYEAAAVDGAGRFRKMWHITLPCIRGTIVVLLIMNLGKMMNSGFEQVYALQNSSVRSVSEVISTYVYRLGIQGGQYGYTAALGLFQSVIGMILIIAANKTTKALGENGLW